jgi:outer membrane cobalamin receptor
MLNNGLSSVYAQLQWRIKRPLSFTAGVRKDDSGVYGKVVTPRLGLVYDKNKFNAKFLYAEAYRAPKPWDYQDGLGNPNLSPEEMRSMELAVGYSFTDHVRGGLSIYRNTLSNGLVREIVGSNRRWTNTGRINTSGFEGDIEYKKDRWKSYLNFTYTGSATADGAEVPEISPHAANAGVQYSFTDRLKLDVRGQYIGKRKNTHPAGASNDLVIDGAFVVHGTLSLANYRGYDLQLAARNIFNKEYYHTSNTSVSMYRQPQSLVTLKVSRQF